MNQHTPGPWKISNPASLVCQEVRNNKDYLVARVGGPFIQDKELTANARLIAKAPEMYEFLKHLDHLGTRQAGTQASLDEDRARVDTLLREIEGKP